jgi:hypothetical protein
VIGSSGSGKSSLVRAGLAPRLAISGGLPGLDRIAVLITTLHDFGADVPRGLCASLVNLPELRVGFAGGDFSSAEALAHLWEQAPEEIARVTLNTLDRWRAALQQAENRKDPPETGLILVLDQLEEIFQLSSEMRDSIARVLAACAHSRRIAVVATLRSDYYTRLLEVPLLKQLKSEGETIDVEPPSPASFSDIIRKPAEAAKLRFRCRSRSSRLCSVADQGASGRNIFWATAANCP